MRRVAWLIVGVIGTVCATAAQAGAGPWTLSPDDRSLFLGAGYTRWQTMVFGEAGDTADVGNPITRSDLGGELTYGLVRGADVEVGAGLAWAGVGITDSDLCSYAAACETTVGALPVRTRLKVRLLDELTAPLTLSAGGELRFGDFTRGNRDRLTALGDGQTDVGAFLSLGRSGGLGSWSYGTFVEATGRRRLALTTLKGVKVPADEVQGTGEFLVYPTPNISLGPAFDALHSLGGLDFGAVGSRNPDVFTSLAVTSVKAGGKLNIRSTDNVTVSISSFGTVFARNNPADFFTLGFGISTFRPAGGIDDRA